MPYGELIIDGTLTSSGVLTGQTYEPIPSVTVEAEKIPAGESMTILDESFAVVAVVPAGDYWVRLNPDEVPIHMTATDFEAQYRVVAP
jgi:hypothetical protein